MSRSVPEWIGKNDDSAMPVAVKARVIVRQEGICACGCDQKLGVSGERIEFDHPLALILGGENRESNIRALRQPCHRTKTAQDVRQKAKEARVRNKHMGLKSPRTSFRGWRKFDGTLVRKGQQ